MADGRRYNSPFEAQFDDGRAQDFIIRQIMRSMHTATLVRVLAVRPDSASVGVVDVQPLVLDQATDGQLLAQTPIYNVPYLRYQGGVSAVILDPAIGDIGVCLFAERDIRTVKTTLQAAGAASDRVFSSADGLYMGGMLNAAPTQFVEFLPAAGGINVTTPAQLHATCGSLVADVSGAASVTAGGTITLTGANIVLNGNVAINGNTTIAGSLANNGANVGSTHVHGGVEVGPGTTAGPQ